MQHRQSQGRAAALSESSTFARAREIDDSKQHARAREGRDLTTSRARACCGGQGVARLAGPCLSASAPQTSGKITAYRYLGEVGGNEARRARVDHQRGVLLSQPARVGV